MFVNMRDVTVFCSDFITSLGLVRTVGEAGYKVECVCYGPCSDYILSSKYVVKGNAFKTCEDAIHYLIEEYPIKENKSVLFTIPDPPAYYVDLNLDVLSKKFILFNAGEPGKIVYWMNKHNISKLAQKYGFNIPWAIQLSKGNSLPKDLSYPVFVKSTISTLGGKRDEGVCNSRQELENKISGLISEDFIVMQYIKKTKEINYFGIAVKGHVYIDYHDVRERFPNDAYGEYNSFHKCAYDDFHSRMIAMIKETNYQGLFDVEFLVDEKGNYYFMEVNFRVDGEIYKLALGIDLPDYWCRLVNCPNNILPEKLETKKENFIGITEITDFSNSVLSGQMNFIPWFWQFISADRRMLFNFKDPMPVIIRIWGIIKRRFSFKKK